MSKTIHQLTSIEAVGDINIDVGDELPISHRYGENDYVTYKTTIENFEASLFNSRLNSLCSEISARLDLGDLAWKSEKELQLSNLAHQNTITYKQIAKTNNVPGKDAQLDPINAKAIPLKQINADFGNLAFMDNTDLNLGDLAHKSKITDADISSSRLSLERSIKGWKDLALSSKEDLNLGEFAYKSTIAIGNKNFLTGQLDVSRIDGIERYDYNLPYASKDMAGGLYTGHANTGKGDYALSLDNEFRGFVNVPWNDTKTTDLTVDTMNGTNGFDLSVSYSTETLSPAGSSGRARTVMSKHVNVTPEIRRNVVFTDSQGNLPEDNFLGVFAANSGEKSVKVKSLGISVDVGTDQHVNRYLSECGKWKSLKDASTDQDAKSATRNHEATHGLLSKADKEFIDELRSKNSIFYTLPVATTTELGGIKLVTDALPDADQDFKLYEGQKCTKIPVRVDASNNAYVALPSNVGDSSKFADQISNSMSDVLKQLYPVGAIYLVAGDTDLAICPLQEVLKGTSWEKIEGRYLLASGKLKGGNARTETYSPKATPSAGLPSHTHNFSFRFDESNAKDGYPQHGGEGGCKHSSFTFTTNGASDSIYGQSTTVRPPAYVVNVFRRTA